MSVIERVYTCPTFLTTAGYNLVGLAPQVVWGMIRAVSADIDVYTKQWFNGELGIWYFDGRGSFLTYFPNMIKIINVTSVEVVSGRTNRLWEPYPTPVSEDPELVTLVPSSPLAADSYVVRDRTIERVRTYFPSGVKNIKVTGALGWVDQPKALSTISETVVDGNSVMVQVTNIAGFQVRDVIDIVGANDSARAVVTAVNRGARQLAFDQLGVVDATIPVGAVVRSFGCVPRPIERLANFFFGRVRRESVEAAAGEAPIDPGRIKRERTDDYEYELFSTSEGGTSSTLLTGHISYDQILMEFRAPGGVRFVGG